MSTKSILSVIIIILAGLAVWLIMSRQEDDQPSLSIIEEENAQTNNEESSVQETNKPKVITMENGLKIEEVLVGTGAEAKAGDTISAHYTGYFENGEVFDSSVSRGQPFSFKLGAGMVIQGWDIGIQGMKVGGKRKLTIPPDLAYGAGGVPNAIPPNSTLIFDVELVKIGE